MPWDNDVLVCVRALADNPTDSNHHRNRPLEHIHRHKDELEAIHMARVGWVNAGYVNITIYRVNDLPDQEMAELCRMLGLDYKNSPENAANRAEYKRKQHNKAANERNVKKKTKLEEKKAKKKESWRHNLGEMIE